jgi:hypothetical protein
MDNSITSRKSSSARARFNHSSDSKSLSLLIYIPSYHRPDKLNSLLDCLLPQVNSYKHCIKIYVSINPSDSDYTSVIDRFACNSIFFSTHAANIGGNANISLGFSCPILSSHLWILSDSDMPTSTAIRTLLASINLDSGLVCFVGSTYSTEISSHNIDYTHLSCASLDWGIGQISNTIYKRSVIELYIQNAYLYHNSSFPHLAVILSAAKSIGYLNICFIPDVLVIDTIDSIGDDTSDYRLARIGMPLLIPLISSAEAFTFTIKWLHSNWFSFIHNRSYSKQLYLQSVLSLLSVGGFNVAFRLLFYRLYYLVYCQILGNNEQSYNTLMLNLKLLIKKLSR